MGIKLKKKQPKTTKTKPKMAEVFARHLFPHLGHEGLSFKQV